MPPARCTVLKKASLNANTYVCSSYFRESEFPTVKLLRQSNTPSLSNSNKSTNYMQQFLQFIT